MSSANAANSAASLAGSATPSGGLGTAYLALQGMSALSGLVGGIAGVGATQSEAKRLNEQADLTLQQANLENSQTATDVKQFYSSQAEGYLNSGVQLQGSPMEVLATTLTRGQQVMDANTKSAQAKSNLIRMQAGQTKRTGLMNLLSSGVSGGATFGTALIQGQRLGLLSGSNAQTATTKSTGKTP